MAAASVVILHERVSDAAGPDARDTLVQVDAVRAALATLGLDVQPLAADGDLDALADRLRHDRPQLVFNLVESLAGSDAAMVAATAVLDGLGIPYTGSPTAACALANDKPAAKAVMRRLGLPTPAWFVASRRGVGPDFAPGSYVIKARFEHASVGLDEEAIRTLADAGAARQAISDREARLGRPCFGEAFVEGREFNVSLLAGPDGVDVLPIAEIDFGAFPEGKPRIVGYRAKWQADSFEFRHTPRRFDFEMADRSLLDRLSALARHAFEAFGLRGYARVDFRVDERGPWLLEVNANPCLSPDAGFAAALERAGIAYPLAIGRIVAAALDDGELDVPHSPHS